MKNIEEKVLDTAQRLFYEQGYHNTGVNQIIEEAGIAKASLYKYYPGKQDIGLAYLNLKAKNWFKQLNGNLSGLNSPEEKIKKTYDFLEDLYVKGFFTGCAFQKMVSEIDPVEDKVIQQEIKRIKILLRKFFQKMAAREEEYISSAEEFTGDQLAILFEGAMIALQVQNEVWPVTAACAASLKIVK
jgi:AcrR family transcriptional regulator